MKEDSASTQTTNNTPVQASVPPAAPITQTPPTVVTPGAFGMPDNATPPTINKKPKFSLPDFKQILEKIKTLPMKFKIMGGFVLLLIFLLILVGFTKPGKQVKDLILPTSSPIPTTAPIGDVFAPSQYANDPEVLGLEKQVKDFDSKLSGTDLHDDNLRVPVLDFDVNFKQK